MSIELEQEPHAEYVKGFNEGYLLQQEMPKLADILAKSMENIESDRAAGFKDGRQQHQMELGIDKGKVNETEKDLNITWMQPLPDDDYDNKSPDPDANKDDLDIEIE